MADVVSPADSATPEGASGGGPQVSSPAPPSAPRRPYVHRRHGVDRPDDYAWMRDRTDPELLSYLAAEREFYDVSVADLAPAREALFAEMAARLPATESSAPWRKGDHLYFTRRRADRQFGEFCRRSVTGEPDDVQVLLDLDEMAGTSSHIRLGVRAVSPDGGLLAYSVDRAADEVYELRFRDADVIGYDSGDYRSERRFVPAPDDVQIPVTLVRHRDTPLDGSAPCYMYGYGAYEAVDEPEFDAALPSLLDRGIVFAHAHIRGGGEMGRGWWRQGRLRSKATTFSDHIAVADALAGSAAASAAVDGSRIVTRGISAGGLLQGAVFNARPDRWAGVVAEVPFVDVISSMSDPTMPLTINEWDEWGDPADPEDFAAMLAYSPYDNLPGEPWPPLLVTGALHDTRVLVHEPAKWTAKLRAAGPASRLLFRAELGEGAHAGPAGRYDRLRYEAEIYAWILAQLSAPSTPSA